jgi:hypothetical protein
MPSRRVCEDYLMLVTAFLAGVVIGMLALICAASLTARRRTDPKPKPGPIRTRFIGVPRERQNIDEVTEFGIDYPEWKSWRQDGKA